MGPLATAMENFIAAKGIDDLNRKKAVFDLCEDLGIVADTTYEQTKQILTAYSAPQRNVEF